MKKWFLDHFLPMWAKETVMRDNIRLVRKNRELTQENECLRSYIRGLQAGLRVCRKKGVSNETP